MKAVIIGMGIKEHILHIVANLKSMSISNPVIFIEAPDLSHLPKYTGDIMFRDMGSIPLFEVPKVLDFDSRINAAKLHDELYALKPGLDSVDVPLIREKKKKLPRKVRKFAGYN